ncbi:MAG TPA: hypothetical protein VNL12_16630 [Iamia sp.]|nr:hypothetical protein [Iamia sp.]
MDLHLNPTHASATLHRMRSFGAGRLPDRRSNAMVLAYVAGIAIVPLVAIGMIVALLPSNLSQTAWLAVSLGGTVAYALIAMGIAALVRETQIRWYEDLIKRVRVKEADFLSEVRASVADRVDRPTFDVAGRPEPWSPRSGSPTSRSIEGHVPN